MLRPVKRSCKSNSGDPKIFQSTVSPAGGALNVNGDTITREAAGPGTGFWEHGYVFDLKVVSSGSLVTPGTLSIVGHGGSGFSGTYDVCSTLIDSGASVLSAPAGYSQRQSACIADNSVCGTGLYFDLQTCYYNDGSSGNIQ